MISNLFFQGPVRSGKSSALRRELLPYLAELGGFVVQRLLDDGGSPVAYRMVSLDQIRQMGEAGGALFLEVDAPYSAVVRDGKSGIFLFTSPREVRKEVFETAGVRCLQAAQGSKLVLLDEIGGVDLLCPLFRQALVALIRRNVPCIGVIKEIEKARDARFYNQELRASLNIRTLSSDGFVDPSDLSCQIKSFLSQLAL